MNRTHPTPALSSSSDDPGLTRLTSRLQAYLRLGRVSNLPTVWTNTLTGVVLAGGSLTSMRVPVLLMAFSLFYTGGMFLNDAFDREIDARERPERPIPSGRITANAVFAMGYGMVGVAMVLAGWMGMEHGWASTVSAIALSAAIIGYDTHHKRNPVAPWVMGLCRALIYLTGAAAVTGSVTAPVAGSAVILLCYVAGLTLFARHKTASPHTVGRLIAGISLLDALLMTSRGAMGGAGIAVLGFFLTLRWQRAVPGT